MKAKEKKPKIKRAPAKKPSKEQRARRSKFWQSVLVPLLAVLTGLLVGAIIIIVTDAEVVAAYKNFFHAPGKALLASLNAVVVAYGALFAGAFGRLSVFISGFQSLAATGDTKGLLKAIYPFTESLVIATPFIFAGLGVAVGFRCGLFNIGAEGQFFIGALCSAFVGYSLTGLPWFIHLPLALLAGALGGAIWAAIPGYLKAATGAHEVVNTIMMNWIAFRLSDWLLTGPMMAAGYRPVTPQIEAAAELPRFFPDPIRLNWGFVLALVLAFVVYWLLFKTTVGFEIRAVGSNPDASSYAGMSVKKNIVLVMAIAGGLCGLAGAAQVLGTDHWVGQGFSAGYGFDALAVALLGNSHPTGVVFAALLFGFLRGGASRMQSMAGIPIDIVSIVQGLVIIFIAAPIIIRWLYRIKGPRSEVAALTPAGANKPEARQP